MHRFAKSDQRYFGICILGQNFLTHIEVSIRERRVSRHRAFTAPAFGRPTPPMPNLISSALHYPPVLGFDS